MSPRDAGELWEVLRARADVEGVRWLEAAADEVERDPASLATAFPAVGRRLGRQPLRARHEQRRPVAAVHEWTVDDAGRALLLVAAGPRAWGELEDLYRFGDAAERRGVLRALHLLPAAAEGTSRGGDRSRRNGRPDEVDHLGVVGEVAEVGGVDEVDEVGEAGPELGVQLVCDAVRTNDPRLLAAALGPYALERLSDEDLNQAVLKCVFVGVPLDGVEGLADRATPALARMLAGYARERVAAGRDVPPDVWPLIEAHPPLDELAALEAELDHPVESRRAAAATALGQRTAHGGRGGSERTTTPAEAGQCQTP